MRYQQTQTAISVSSYLRPLLKQRKCQIKTKQKFPVISVMCLKRSKAIEAFNLSLTPPTCSRWRVQSCHWRKEHRSSLNEKSCWTHCWLSDLADRCRQIVVSAHLGKNNSIVWEKTLNSFLQNLASGSKVWHNGLKFKSSSSQFVFIQPKQFPWWFIFFSLYLSVCFRWSSCQGNSTISHKGI